MAGRAEGIASSLKTQIEGFDATVTETNVGTVIKIGDGIAKIHGLGQCMAMELIEFSDGTRGLALNLEEETVGAVVLGDATGIKEGDEVRTTGLVAAVPGGEWGPGAWGGPGLGGEMAARAPVAGGPGGWHGPTRGLDRLRGRRRRWLRRRHRTPAGPGATR